MEPGGLEARPRSDHTLSHTLNACRVHSKLATHATRSRTLLLVWRVWGYTWRTVKEFAVVAKTAAEDHGGPAPEAAAPFIGAHVPFIQRDAKRDSS